MFVQVCKGAGNNCMDNFIKRMVTFFFQLRAYRIYAASDPEVCLNPIRMSDLDSASSDVRSRIRSKFQIDV
uniref:Uncharacterized protein n=1 Tax=Acrobeloides nanus TaxID=290746 RepID=A0A914DIY7_9BILA